MTCRHTRQEDLEPPVDCRWWVNTVWCPFRKKNQSPVLNSNRAFESGAGSRVLAGDQTTLALCDEFWAQTEILTDGDHHLRRKQKDNKGSGQQSHSEIQKESKVTREHVGGCHGQHRPPSSRFWTLRGRPRLERLNFFWAILISDWAPVKKF